MSTIATAFGRAFAQMLLPPTCCICGAHGGAAELDLCEICATLLPLNASIADASPLFGPTLVRVLVPFHYRYPIDHLIRALKFRGERVHARVLGTLLAHSVRALRQSLPRVMVPIPLHSQRYRQRGFNQAHELARYAGVQLGLTVDAHCLVRTVSTVEQSGLSLKQRRRNVQGAFEAVRKLSIERVALVDDVLTTGNTALAAAQALLDAGVGEVELWAVARVTLH
jgi:ComF family protein